MKLKRIKRILLWIAAIFIGILAIGVMIYLLIEKTFIGIIFIIVFGFFYWLVKKSNEEE